MAKWNPETDPVGNNEHVGRRLFDEPMLMGITDQPSFSGLNLRHFEETRGDHQFSVDRMGASSVSPKVKNYLIPKAHAAGQKFTHPKVFNGWVVATSKDFRDGFNNITFSIEASPQKGTDENKYHAHIVLDPSKDAVTLSLYLREIFNKRKMLERVSGKRPSSIQRLRDLCNWISEKIRSL